MAALQYFCYIEPQRFTLIGNSGINVQLSFAGVVLDLEVVDSDKLTALIEQFLQSHSVASGMVTILLAPSLLFEQDISTIPLQNKDNTIQRFLESVPFENVGSKVYMVNGKERLVAANEELYGTIKRTFEKKGLPVVAIIPYSLVQANVAELATSVNPTVIFSKLDSLKQYALEVAIARPTGFEQKTGLRGRRDMALLGVFGVLLLILILLLVTTYVIPHPMPTQRPLTNPSKTLTFPTAAPHATESAKEAIPSPGK